MKLPDGLPIFPTSYLDWVGYEAIVRDCAKVCEQMQARKDSKVPDGAWSTLGTTEISGRSFAAAILARYSLEPT